MQPESNFRCRFFRLHKKLKLTPPYSSTTVVIVSMQVPVLPCLTMVTMITNGHIGDKKILILLSCFVPILFSPKNKPRAKTTQNNENAFSILVLDFQPESIFR